jgi:predicted PurR-regulated permease PerM
VPGESTVERHSSLRSRLAFALLFIVALALTGYVLWPFRVPLLFAGVLASVLQGVFQRICRLCRGRRWLAALITSLGLFVVLIGPLAAAVTLAVQQIIHGLGFVRDQLGIHSVAQLEGNAQPHGGLPLAKHVLGVFHLTIEQVQHFAIRASSWAEHSLQSVVASSSKAAFHGGVMLIVFYFLLVEGQRLIQWLRRLSPLEAHETEDLLQEFRTVARATILGAVISSMFQAVAATIGYFIVRLPHAVFFGLLTLLASFIPVVGTPIIWVPASALLWGFGHHLAAISLLVWCSVLVSGVEHVGKPFVLKFILHNREPMHTGLVFLSLLGGIQMFGLIGLVLGPLVVAFFLAMVRMYERRLAPDKASRH